MILAVFLIVDVAVSQFARQDSVFGRGKIIFTLVREAPPPSRLILPFLDASFFTETYSSIMAARVFLLDKATAITQDLHWWFELKDIKEDWIIGLTLTHDPGRFIKVSWNQRNVGVWIDIAFLF